MSNDRYDDGLVHSHNWAAEPPHPAQPRPRTAPRPTEECDDGLVHGHGWACGERGRPAH